MVAISGTSILLVEDNAVIGLAEENVLRSHGMDVIRVVDGASAVEVVARGEEIDLVLMDIDLGSGMDGPAAAERILELRDLPIIFLTAHGEQETVGRVENIARYGYVLKSAGEFVLLQSISGALELFVTRRRVEEERRVTVEILSLLNGTEPLAPLMATVAELLRAWTGCEAVGIREDHAAGFPFVGTSGYSAEFLAGDRELCRGMEQIARRNCVCPECMCRRVIEGDIDPALPFFTPYGSFFAGRTSTMGVGRCTRMGFETLVLVPLRSENKIIGLIQINDTRARNLELEQIEACERIAGSLALGLSRRRSTDALARSTAVLQKAQKIAGIGSWEYDLATDRLEWSDQVYSIFGVAEKDFGGHAQDYHARVHPDDRERILGAYEGYRRLHESALDYEHRIVRDDTGSVRYVRLRCEHVVDSGGRVTGSIGMVEDITAARKARDRDSARLRLIEFSGTHGVEELLRRFLDEAEALTDSAIGFFHFVSDDQQSIELQTWSTNTLSLHCRLSDGERHYPISDAGVWVDCIRLGRPVIHNDYRRLPHRKGLPDGHVGLVRELVVPIARHGKIVAILGVGNKAWNYDEQDVTTVFDLADLAWETIVRRRAEEELARSRANLVGLIENTDGLIWSVDAEGRLIIANSRFLETAETCTGRRLEPGDEVPGLSTDPDEAGIWHDWYVRAFSGDRFTREHVCRRSTGEERVFEFAFSPLRDESGEVSGATIHGRDISEHREAEATLERAVEAKTALVREMNHRVKNNLLLLSSLVHLREAADGFRGDYSEFERQIDTIRGIHEQLMDTGESMTIRVRDYLLDVVRGVLRSYSGPAVAHSVEVAEMDLPARTAVPLGLIVNEITTNAVKYGFRGDAADSFGLRLEVAPLPGMPDAAPSVCTLTAWNTGAPFPESIDPLAPETLGMRLIEALVKQIRGGLEFEREPATTYRIHFEV